MKILLLIISTLFFTALLIIVFIYFLRFLDRNNQGPTRYKKPLFLFDIVYLLLSVNINIINKKNIPKNSGFLVISNHQSNIDPLITFTVFKGLGFVAKKSMTKAPFVNQFMIRLGCYFLDRDSLKSAMSIFKIIAADIKENKTVLIFPEGTRSKQQELGEFKKGAFLLPKLAKCTLVPITINNSYKTKFLKRNTVDVIIHKPILYSEYANIKTEDLCDNIKDIIQKGLY